MAKRKGLLWAAGGAILLATVFAPDLRLNAQLAAARREGLWTTAGDVRRAIGTVAEGDNAAPLVWRAIAADRATKRPVAEDDALRLVSEGKATPAQTALARRALPSLRASLERWRKASERPRLDYGRRYEDGFRVLFPELAPIKRAASVLVAAAKLGERPEANLRAAARLSALVRHEPGTIQQWVGVEAGRLALREAARQGMGHVVESELGPAPDVRRILGPDLPALLDLYSLRDYEGALTDLGVKDSIGLDERFAHWGPMAKVNKAAGVVLWRRLWSRLPQDGADLDAAAKVVDLEMPAIDALTPTISSVMAKLSAGSRGDALRDLARFEAERRRARTGSSL